MVHTGFLKAWTASGLHTEVISYLQVPCPEAVWQAPAYMLHDPVGV